MFPLTKFWGKLARETKEIRKSKINFSGFPEEEKDRSVTEEGTLMEEFASVESGYFDSTSTISEPPDITNWFSNYVYESSPLCSSIKESESSIGEEKENLGVAVSDSRSPEKFFLNKDHKPMCKKLNQISDTNLHESLLSEPPDIGNWFSSYVYESPVLHTSDGLEYSVPGESECVKETETEKETTKIDGNDVCPRFLEQELVHSAKVTDFSQSQLVLSEPPDVRNWFSSYEYQSPQLSDTHDHELGFSSFEKDELIVDESETEEEDSSGIFRKTKSKQEAITPDAKNNIALDTAKEVSTDNTYSDQEMEKNSSVGGLNKEVKQESSFKQEPSFSEPEQVPSFIPGVSRYNPKAQFPSENETSLHELRPKHIQETIPTNSNKENFPMAFREENQESIDQKSDDKENVQGKSTETGFVTTKKARFREARGPNTGVLVGCSRSKELKHISEEDDKEERKKRRRVLREMSNHQFSRSKEITGKWRCPQKNKGHLVPPLKQLRLDAWIHKV